jgi:hypothetical protein
MGRKKKKCNGLNVHHYKSCLHLDKHVSTDTSKDEIIDVINDIKLSVSLTDSKVEAILESMKIIGPHNYDKTNDIHIYQILPGLWLKIKDNPDGVSLLKEELTAMLRGGCPQGRVVRIYQLYKAFCS